MIEAIPIIIIALRVILSPVEGWYELGTPAMVRQGSPWQCLLWASI